MVCNCSQPHQLAHVANDNIDISMSKSKFTLFQVQSLCTFYEKEHIYQMVGKDQKPGVAIGPSSSLFFTPMP